MTFATAVPADASSRPEPIDPTTIFTPDTPGGGDGGKGGDVVPLRPSNAGPDGDVQAGPHVIAAVRAKGGEGGDAGRPASPALPPSATSATETAAAAPPRAPARAVPGNAATEVYTPAPPENPVVTALRTAGLYLDAIGEGGHRITCPWADEHERPDGDPATYAEPSDAHRLGSFRCGHQHSGRPRIRDLLDFLRVDPDRATGKAIIRVLPGEMNRIADAAERVLAGVGGFYQSGNQIVRIRRDVETGDVRTEPLADGSMAKALSAGAVWLKWDGRLGKFVRADPPPRHVTMLLREQDYPLLPKLKGLARQPYLDADGRVVAREGYDSSSQTFGAFSPTDFPMPKPTEAAAREALAALKALVAEFHLRSDHDRSATVAAMLTAAMRSQLPLAPAFNISASMSGSGKSYLAGLLALFAGPGQPMNISYPVRAEEAGKAILTMLMTQPAVVLFDDMQTNWIPHGIINRMLTSETISDRKLGGNEAATVGTTTLVMGTGNNVEPERDMRRRVVSVYLAPLADSPATLSYVGRPLDTVRADRGRYVAHALTIVRAWIAAGRPITAVSEIGSFGVWSDLCRQPILWLGEPDPATSLVAQVESDPDVELLATLLRAWHREFGLQAAMVRTVIARGEDDPEGELWQTMLEMPFMGVKGVDRNRFGHFLKKNANRVAGGLQIVKADCSERNAWAVVPKGMASDGFAPVQKSGGRLNYPTPSGQTGHRKPYKEVF